MTTEHVLRPVYADPHHHGEWDEDRGEQVTTGVGWHLSSGCQVSFAYDPDGHLVAHVSTFGSDQRSGVTNRIVTPEQICQFAHMLLDQFGPKTEEAGQ